MLKILTKLIDFLERHTKDQAKRELYQQLENVIDQYVYKTTGTVTLRYWRYFVLDKDWIDKVKGKSIIDEIADNIMKRGGV